MKPRVLHLSADFPDPLVPAKTPVIRRLLDLSSSEFDHHVISLNRRSPAASAIAAAVIGTGPILSGVGLQPFDHGHYLSYEAPPGGLLHRSALQKLADELAEQLADKSRPDLIVGHKLTVEGLVVQRLAAKWDVPYAITIQGNTDTKIARFRPDLAAGFRDILAGAGHVFCFAPWARDRIAEQLGVDMARTQILPCPTQDDTVLAPRSGGGDLLSVFHLRNYRGKNLALLIDAMRDLRRRGISTPLSVIGGGSEEDISACRKMTRGLEGVTFAGARQQPALRAIMNNAIAFVMPSKRESFGLVFTEALFAGLPIIYPKGTSVDGYFDNLPFAISVDAGDRRAVADAIAFAVENEQTLKSALGEWQNAGGLERFARPAIATRFIEGLRAAIGT